MLRCLIDAFGPRSLARLLDVEPGSISDWMSSGRRLSPELARRVINLHDVLTRAFQVFQPDTAMRWLVGSEPFLEYRRPLDVLVMRGAAPVIEALDNIDAGAFA